MSESVYERIDKGRTRLLFEAAASHSTKYIAAYVGRRIPIYSVSEYPRSGGTWLSAMMADYLRCAKPTASLFPIGCRAVVHNHWQFHKRFSHAVYLMRDGRDVMISLYFYVMRSYKKSRANAALESRMDRRIADLFQPDFDPDDVLSNLPKFLEAEFERPFASGKTNWARHVESWLSRADRSKVLFLKYEDLLENTAEYLRFAIEHVSPIRADNRLLQRSIDHHRMSAITGRQPGQADMEAFVRKGIAGDWKNYFDTAAADVFVHYGANALQSAGYEKDNNWTNIGARVSRG